MSSVRFWLRPERIEPTMKTASAARNTFRRLQRSESLAKIGMLAVEAMTYALMTNVPLFGWPNWIRIVGSAVRATKLSSAPIRRASRIPMMISDPNRGAETTGGPFEAAGPEDTAAEFARSVKGDQISRSPEFRDPSDD